MDIDRILLVFVIVVLGPVYIMLLSLAAYLGKVYAFKILFEKRRIENNGQEDNEEA